MRDTKRKRVIIYCRVSTEIQTNLNQIRALKLAARYHDWDVVAVCWDRKTGKNTARPGYQKLIKYIRSRRCDMVAVWSLSRAGRSLKDLNHFLNEELDPNKVEFFSLKESIDTSTPSGRLIFNIMASIAQFEREHTVEKVMAGLERAKAQGKKLGKPTLETPGSKHYKPNLVNSILDLHRQGNGNRAITRLLKCNIQTVRRILRSNGIDTTINKQFKYGPEITAKALKLHATGLDTEAIALECGCSVSTVKRILNRNGIKQTQRLTHGLA